MVNIDDFIKRLEIVLEYYSLNASSFADKIGVQRSSLSHLLSGRNKPSLDFILKITSIFPEVDLYWILNGKGNFPKINGSESNSSTSLHSENKPITPTPLLDEKKLNDLFSEIPNPIPEKKIEMNPTELQQLAKGIPNSSEVEKIVFFYKNGSFRIFE